MKHWTDWAFAGALAVYALAIVKALGLVDIGKLLYDYQTLIVGLGALIVGYLTIGATRRAALDQVEGVRISTEQQIAESRRLVEIEIAAQREDARTERSLRASALALAVGPSVIDIALQARNIVTFSEDRRAKGIAKVTRDGESIGRFKIVIQASLIRSLGDLHYLGRHGGDILRMVSLIEWHNQRLESPRALFGRPPDEIELADEENNAEKVIEICKWVILRLAPLNMPAEEDPEVILQEIAELLRENREAATRAG